MTQLCLDKSREASCGNAQQNLCQGCKSARSGPVAAVDAFRQPPAAGAGSAWSYGLGGEDNDAVVDGEAIKSQNSRVGQKRMAGHVPFLPASVNLVFSRQASPKDRKNH